VEMPSEAPESPTNVVDTPPNKLDKWGRRGYAGLKLGEIYNKLYN